MAIGTLLFPGMFPLEEAVLQKQIVWGGTWANRQRQVSVGLQGGGHFQVGVNSKPGTPWQRRWNRAGCPGSDPGQNGWRSCTELPCARLGPWEGMAVRDRDKEVPVGELAAQRKPQHRVTHQHPTGPTVHPKQRFEHLAVPTGLGLETQVASDARREGPAEASEQNRWCLEAHWPL